jgi:nucleoside triphosphate diphosphatase
MTDETDSSSPDGAIPGRTIDRLIAIMAALRTPVTGCPWDLEQTFETIAPYTIEEAYEVADAIERQDMGDLREELGDLLLQVVYHARIAEEAGLFSFPDVVEAITRKLVRRHPHVFGEGRSVTPQDVKALWTTIKAEEKAERAARRGIETKAHDRRGLLAEVAASMPALARAIKLQEKAGSVGFDWNDIRTVLEKIREETEEIAGALDDEAGQDELSEEIGDLLFAVANVARHANVDPERALRTANAKFERRFAYIEDRLRERGRPLFASSLDEMDSLWNEAKSKGL